MVCEYIKSMERGCVQNKTDCHGTYPQAEGRQSPQEAGLATINY